MGRRPLSDPCLPDRCLDRRLHVSLVKVTVYILPSPARRSGTWPGRTITGVNSFLALGYFFSSIDRKHSRIIPIQVALMQFLQNKVALRLGQDHLGKRGRAVFQALAIMDGQDTRIEIEAMHAQLQAFERAQTTAIRAASPRDHHGDAR